MPWFFFGGPVGTGAQVMSWISLDDLVNGIDFLIDHRHTQERRPPTPDDMTSV